LTATPAAEVTHNQWTDPKCAKAFWDQQKYSAYRRLLADTIDWAAPQAGERWLDLGCGSGPLSDALWQRTGGRVGEVVGVDCAAVNVEQYARLQSALGADPARLRFVCHDFSGGLGLFDDGAFDCAVSGLSLTYAESWDADRKQWTQAAYDRIFAEVARVLKPGGRFVFSVNVPSPSWVRVALSSAGSLIAAAGTRKALRQGLRMMRYGRWLKREARTGRFHYLPHADVAAKLKAAGFTAVEHRLSYAGQAYVFRAVAPA